MEHRLKKTWQTLCLSILFFWFVGCGGTSSEPSFGVERVAAAQRTAATTSARCAIRYARGFSITYHNNYKVVTIFDPAQSPRSKPTATFVLVPRGTRKTNLDIPDKGTVIEIPLERVVLRSSSHAPFFTSLGLADRIVGIAQGKYVNDPDVTNLIRRGRIAEVGMGSGMTAQFDVEKLFALRPDLVFCWWTNNPAYAGHVKVQEAGLPVTLLSDYEESTPLARTEWIKFIAAFFNVEAKAESFFNNVEQRYLAMAAKTRSFRHRPTVMYGNSWQGSWYIAGGKSYFANLVKDAGGQYIWNDDSRTDTHAINVETAVIRGRNADYWLTQNQNHFSLASVAAEDSRYKLFRSFRAGRVYANNAKIGPGGGNDYYVSPAIRPDLLLADVIAIIHPELLPGHKLIWHVHLPPDLSDKAGSKGMRER